MSWTDRLNGRPGRICLGDVGVDVYHWAELADTVANPPHRHTYFEVCWVEDGHGEFIVDSERFPVGPGWLLFARPGVRHQIISVQPPGIRLTWVAFHLRVPTVHSGELAELFAAFAGSSRPVAADSRRQVAALWSVLRTTADAPSIPGQEAAAGALAQALLVALAQAGAESLRPTAVSRDTGAAAVQHALRYVEDNLDRPLTVDELARQVHLSRRQLTRLFAERVGRPPAAYVERARLDHAAALLVRTDLPIKHIAAGAGYRDVAQFTRAFTRLLGTPPGRFRRAADLTGVLTAGGADRQAHGSSAQ